MDPVQRFPSPVSVFKTDEEYKAEFDIIYECCRMIFMEYHEISKEDIIRQSADIETARLIKKLIKEEFLSKNENNV